MSYKAYGLDQYIWWKSGDSVWIMSAVKGTLGADYWSRADSSEIGAFTPEGGATGTATVTAT